MIEDSYVYNQFKRIECKFQNSQDRGSMPPIRAQIALGVTGKEWKDQNYPASCKRHKLLFNTHGVIPRYCFDCYKIEIHPSTVMELFKLMIVFNELNLEDNNHRKLWLRPQKTMPVNYSGTIYFQSLTKAIKSIDNVKSVIDKEIRQDIPIKIKRGCSEFNHVLPNYHDIKESYDSLVGDKSGWREIELDFDRSGAADVLRPIVKSVLPLIADFNEYHYRVLCAWLKYARTIGDDTYLKVAETPVD